MNHHVEWKRENQETRVKKEFQGYRRFPPFSVLSHLHSSRILWGQELRERVFVVLRQQPIANNIRHIFDRFFLIKMFESLYIIFGLQVKSSCRMFLSFLTFACACILCNCSENPCFHDNQKLHAA